MPDPHPVRVARWVHQRYRFPGPPANFVAVLGDNPIQVDYRDWPPEEVSGVFVRGLEVSSIGVNQNHSTGRRHFTMWHEFYHYLVHHDQWNFQCTLWEERLRERECDVFAAHVLMPEAWVVSLKGPLWMAARRLAVSQQALSRRFDELGIRRLE
jgi:Zn-dependent peptidase ImmA (M78 family)